MIFKQFYEPSLGHASYLIGSEETREALVLDVRRDVDNYYEYACNQNLRIAYAADTHLHNDYLTGITQLEARATIELLASARAELGYAARPLDDGERLTMGEVEFETLHTPGHTPEHISLLVRDKDRGDDPLMLLSGGVLLVADVARPDLLGDEAENRRNAKAMCRTLKEIILPLPDHVMVFPTHVAGSLCGGNIGSMLMTTIGYERRLNDMLMSISSNEADFEQRCLDIGPLPTVPPYWRRMRKQNQDGPALLGVLSEPPALPPAEFMKRMSNGALVVDCRAPEAFAGAYIPDSLNVGEGTSFPTWAGSILPKDARILLVVDDPSQLRGIYWMLLRIGYNVPEGWLAGGMRAWRTAAQPIRSLPQMTPKELDARRNQKGLFILDVRQPAEWADGHVPDAHHISGGELPDQLNNVPRDKTVAVYCGTGYRSSVAASLLKRNGHQQVCNVIGGFTAWEADRLPVEGG
jgi:hydroxyacylglutathione hydrolase